jgi:hypothetical protein
VALPSWGYECAEEQRRGREEWLFFGLDAAPSTSSLASCRTFGAEWLLFLPGITWRPDQGRWG